MKKYTWKSVLLSIIFTVFLSEYMSGQAVHDHNQAYFPVEDVLVQKKLEEWKDLKFGMLMHWGAYSQWGIVESWSLCPEDYGWCARRKGSSPENYFGYKEEYENLISTFNPVDFNPDKWAAAAKGAGMKYVVFTTKHHDGFCMFDTKETDYKVTGPKSPFRNHERANITKEIFDAFRNEGMWAGAYFSKPDWHSPYYWDPYFPPLDRNVNYDPEAYPEKWEKFVQFTHNQIMELMTDYGKIDILWLDGGWVAKKDPTRIRNFYQGFSEQSAGGFLKSRSVNQDIRMDELASKAREKQPGLIVVDRAVPGKNQNYLTPENQVPEAALPFPWESCIIAGGGWSWVPDARYKSGRETIHMLVDIVAKGGNLLLNFAPGPDGKWHDEAYVLLKEIGDWMDVNGEAIYGTRAIAPYKDGKVCLTSKGENTVYAIYLPEENETSLPSKVWLNTIQAKNGSSVELLGHGKMKWEKSGNGMLIHVPKSIINTPPCKEAWAFKITTQ
jgi:alpha-L-fucosidase